MTKPIERDETGRAAKAAAILGAIFSAAAFSFYGSRHGLSVAIGAIIAIANLLTMRAIIRSLLVVPADEDPNEKKNAEHKEAGRRGGAAWGLFAVFKILILFGGVWLLLSKGLVDPIALVVGYGVLPLGIAAGSLWSSLRPR